MSDPSAQKQRSFVYHKLVQAGAKFGAHGGQLHALDIPGSASETGLLDSVSFCDLSAMPRVGFKGREIFQWLGEKGISCEETPNKAFKQSDGGLCAVLSPGEVLLLSPLNGNDTTVSRLEDDWEMVSGVRCYAVPRSSLSFEFLIVGRKSPEMFSKICGVDFRTNKFAVGDIAQTSMARMNATVIRDDVGNCPAYRLLGDSASAEYLWDCLLDAMEEFGGGAIGFAQVLGLQGKS